MALTIYQNTHIDENHETGEITRQVTENVVRFPREPEYVKMYVDDLSSILNLGKGASKLLCALVRKLDYDGLISLPAYIALNE
ncbi:hypothetical protein Psal071_00914 [Piscirickettsia salmonis]|uniref:Uncharacterized protein n=1 Tax=Piscirickettsia salmonis TaxID=1238 RepID=A0A9Q5YFI9_PISSA|nr:hypothetical protein [Piscirickettsia salmonis]APS58372.1 hypothetical protein AVI52_14760 [Piscirickettsia salmonis]PEQ15026.1 hypothetical protein X973_15065 [Piscirickettsia salmonis]QGN76711.1 hypothetical protein Psal001_00902 [Piscirickettsia salmonis]QGN80301.1 hypothetical protein Psal002_00927 [Piscirickettsia salmonis]QGN85427.1 hypothetical protein Psal003_02505 [Piscirickettsia salmonis]